MVRHDHCSRELPVKSHGNRDQLLKIMIQAPDSPIGTTTDYGRRAATSATSPGPLFRGEKAPRSLFAIFSRDGPITDLSIFLGGSWTRQTGRAPSCAHEVPVNW
jgi:hypothetical protein